VLLRSLFGAAWHFRADELSEIWSGRGVCISLSFVRFKIYKGAKVSIQRSTLSFGIFADYLLTSPWRYPVRASVAVLCSMDPGAVEAGPAVRMDRGPYSSAWFYMCTLYSRQDASLLYFSCLRSLTGDG
jgi:hypothetical protein